MSVRILLALSFNLIGILNAQNSLTIVSENGEPFWLYLNGYKVNDSAQAIVTTTDIEKDNCLTKIVYLNTKLADVVDKVNILQRGKSCKDYEFTYAIETTKGKTALKYISSDIITTSEDPKVKPTALINNVFKSLKQQEDNKNRLAQNYPTPTLCLKTVSDSLVEKQLIKLRDNHIELNRVKDAKWFISNNCLSILQVQKMLTAFDYEDSKLQLSEFAYDYIYDKENFMQLIKSLKYITEQSALKKFYDSKKSP